MNKIQKDLQTLLGAFSGVPLDNIGLQTSIYQLGIDSIGAIQLASRLRKERSIEISAADILRRPRLTDLAEFLQRYEKETEEDSEPSKSHLHHLELLRKRWLADFDVSVLQINDERGPQVDMGKIERVLPCTPLQDGILSQFVGSRQGQDLYVNAMAYEFSTGTSSNQIRAAWRAVQRKHPILRTGFAAAKDTTSQFAMIVYNSTNDYENFLLSYKENHDLETSRRNASSRFRNSLHKPPWEVSFMTKPQSPVMHIAILHAIFDAHSLRIILDDFLNAMKLYDDKIDNFTGLSTDSALAIASILECSHSSSSSAKSLRKTFWQKSLGEVSACRFPNLSPLHFKQGCIKSTTLSSSHDLRDLQDGCRSAGFTLHAAGQAAWARLLSAYTGEPVVAFGTVLSGRDIIPNGDIVVFPCLTTVATVGYCKGSNKDLVESLMQFNSLVRQHQFTHLATLQRPNEPLFDTLYALQRLSGKSEHGFKAIEEISTAEVGFA